RQGTETLGHDAGRHRGGAQAPSRQYPFAAATVWKWIATTCDASVRLSALVAYGSRSRARTSASGCVYFTPMRASLMASSNPSCGVAVFNVASHASMSYLLGPSQVPVAYSRRANARTTLPLSRPTRRDRALDLDDVLRDLDPPRAGVRAVVRLAATPHAIGSVHGGEMLLRMRVPRVEHEPVRGHDRRRADVAAVGPEHGTRAGACRAEDALGGVVEGCTFLRGLEALPRR